MRPVVEARTRCTAAAEIITKFNEEIDTVFTKNKRITIKIRTTYAVLYCTVVFATCVCVWRGVR